MSLYRTKDGDVIDDICFAFYGDADNSIVDAVVVLNPHIAAYDDVMPAGVLIELPTKAPKNLTPEPLERFWTS